MFSWSVRQSWKRPVRPCYLPLQVTQSLARSFVSLQVLTVFINTSGFCFIFNSSPPSLPRPFLARHFFCTGAHVRTVLIFWSADILKTWPNHYHRHLFIDCPCIKSFCYHLITDLQHAGSASNLSGFYLRIYAGRHLASFNPLWLSPWLGNIESNRDRTAHGYYYPFVFHLSRLLSHTLRSLLMQFLLSPYLKSCINISASLFVLLRPSFSNFSTSSTSLSPTDL